MAVIYDHEPLRARVAKSLADDFKHEAIETAQNVIGAKRDALVAQVEAWEQFRTAGARIRDHVLKNLDYYVRQFAENAQAAGCILHFAPTGEDAVEAVAGIFEELGETSCVKSKSMMTEEIGLNAYLAARGIAATETDCAEHILQTAGDEPSHIVVPALHMDRTRIRELYRDRKGYQGSDDPEEITRFLRETLRPEFLASHVGITGCNFAVAETGSCTLVSNEGNARMVTCVPETQIIVMGVERIVPDLRSLDTMVELLVRSAVGSKITSSFSLNTGPRRPGEADGPERVHIVIVDNGRANILGGEYSSILRCIRCGACMNTCPVYRHITGHGYGSIYPGPMGVVLTPLLTGYDESEKLPYACTLCGACANVCPVKIPLNSLILHHRNDMVDGGHVSFSEKAAFKAAGKMLSSRPLYDMLTGAGAGGMRVIGSKKSKRLGANTAWIPVLRGWTGSRDMDLIAKKRFRDQFADHVKQRAQKQEETLQSSADEAHRGIAANRAHDAKAARESHDAHRTHLGKKEYYTYDDAELQQAQLESAQREAAVKARLAHAADASDAAHKENR